MTWLPQSVLCLISEHITPFRIDPVATRILNDYIPFPNLPGNLWQGNIPNPFNSNEYLVKVDHQLNEPHRLTFSYFNTAGNTTVFPGNGNLPWATQDFKWRQHNLNISDVWVISPETINQVWLTYTRMFGGRNNRPATTLRDLGSTLTPQGVPSLPQITVAGFFTLSNAIGGPVAGTDLYSIRNVFSWNKGRHSVKIGGEISLNKDIQDTLLNNYGVFTFNGSVTARPAFPAPPAPPTVPAAGGNGLADFLLGIPSGLTQDAPVTAYTNSWYMALFLQDDFRIHPKVTLNLGVRWDVQTPPTDPLNRVMNYVPGQRSIVNPLAPPGPLFYGDPGVERSGIPTDYGHFSPRVGVAWDPFGDGKTSIRAGAGLFWGSISGNEWNTMTNFQPYATRLTFPNVNITTNAAGVPNGATLRNPYNNFPGGNPFPYTGAFTTGGSLFGVASDFTWPRTFHMNVSVQRQIMKDLTLGLAWVETLSSHLPFGRDVNYPNVTATATTNANNILSRRPNPSFGSVTILDSDQEANYHGLQVTGNYRLGRRVSLNGFYTLSKTWSSVQLHNNTTQGLAQNFSMLGLENGRADTDQRHVFSMSGNVEPEFYRGDNKILKAIVNGWSFSPILRMRSGRPFTVTNGNIDANLDGQSNDRARLIGDPHLDNPTPDRWFNIFAFAQNLVVNGRATEGNTPRNFLTGPGYKAVDLAVSRDFRFGESYKLRLRAEGTNIFNMVNLDQPNSSTPATVGQPNSNFGRILGAGPMRRLQFGARFTF